MTGDILARALLAMPRYAQCCINNGKIWASVSGETCIINAGFAGSSIIRPHKTRGLKDTAKLLADSRDAISMEPSKGIISPKIICGKTRISTNADCAIDAPTDYDAAIPCASIDAARLAKALKKLAKSTTKLDRVPRATDGIQWQLADKSIRLSATDTCQLVNMSIDADIWDEQKNKRESYPVSDAMLNFLKLDTMAIVGFLGQTLVLRNSEGIFATKSLGTFPAIDAIIPHGNDEILRYDAGEMNKALSGCVATNDDITIKNAEDHPRDMPREMLLIRTMSASSHIYVCGQNAAYAIKASVPESLKNRSWFIDAKKFAVINTGLFNKDEGVIYLSANFGQSIMLFRGANDEPILLSSQINGLYHDYAKANFYHPENITEFAAIEGQSEVTEEAPAMPEEEAPANEPISAIEAQAESVAISAPAPEPEPMRLCAYEWKPAWGLGETLCDNHGVKHFASIAKAEAWAKANLPSDIWPRLRVIGETIYARKTGKPRRGYTITMPTSDIAPTPAQALLMPLPASPIQEDARHQTIASAKRQWPCSANRQSMRMRHTRSMRTIHRQRLYIRPASQASMRNVWPPGKAGAIAIHSQCARANAVNSS